jgi:hypothetical protein
MQRMSFYPFRWLRSLLFPRTSFEKIQTTEGGQFQLADDAAPVRCRLCRAVVTQHDGAIELAGSHQHVYTNPAGIRFVIVLYRYAYCELAGEATTEFSWFSGYAWQMAYCGNCGSHLGWYYTRSQFPDFYGLIRPRLDLAAPGGTGM